MTWLLALPSQLLQSLGKVGGAAQLCQRYRLVLIGFVLYAETKRNARLRSRAEEARARIRKLFEGWE
jgi:hypothetical protein